MKKIIFFALFSAFFFLAFDAAQNGGLVAHYTFETCDAKDEIGRSDGTLFGNPECGCGVVGNALYFDGFDDYVKLNGVVNDVVGKEDFTITFYYKTNAHATKQILLAKRETCTTEQPFLESKYLQPCGGKPTGRVRTDLAEANGQLRARNAVVDATRWMHISLVRTGMDFNVYFNGEVIKNYGPFSEIIDFTNAAPITLGFSPCVLDSSTEPINRYFPLIGAMDEVRIYNKSLTADQIKLLYNQAPVETAERDCSL